MVSKGFDLTVLRNGQDVPEELQKGEIYLPLEFMAVLLPAR